MHIHLVECLNASAEWSIITDDKYGPLNLKTIDILDRSTYHWSNDDQKAKIINYYIKHAKMLGEYNG